jgi:hypothetical protein
LGKESERGKEEKSGVEMEEMKMKKMERRMGRRGKIKGDKMAVF